MHICWLKSNLEKLYRAIGQHLPKLQVDTPFGREIPVPGIHPTNMFRHAYNATYARLFIITLLVIAERPQKLKHLSIETGRINCGPHAQWNTMQP